jgi:hypothetical protein
VVNGKISESSDKDLIYKIQAGKINELKTNFEDALCLLEQNEDKAKTLLLEWLAGDKSGPPPDYWTNWKSGRDSIDSNYQIKKAYLLASSRTITQLKEYNVNL